MAPPRTPSRALFAFVVVVTIIVAGVGAGLLYEANHPKRPASPERVAVGDNITVNYIGYFGSGPELGKVFDTSLKAVADNNASYPKSLEYTPRNASGYTPLAVHVGAKAPKGGYTFNGVTYGQVVTGFWQGLLGLALNQTKTTPAIPPYLGYGPLNQSCLQSAPLTQTLPASVSYTPDGFAKTYTGATAAVGATFRDPVYGWTDQVLSANATAVVVGRMPSVGQVVSPFGWAVRVTAVSASSITLQNQISASSVGSVLGVNANKTVCSSTKFLIWSVNAHNGTFVENYNREVVGVTLLFDVTVVSIAPRS